MFAVSEAITRTGYLLNDIENITYTVDEMVLWAYDGAAAILRERPPAGTETEQLTLTEGALQQPTGNVIQILDITRVVGGRPIERTSRRQLDSWEPDWYQEEPTSDLIHYTYDERKPTQFYVYPPAKAGTVVEGLVVRLPDPFTKDSDIPMGREYLDPLVSYMAHRAISKDTDYADSQLAILFYQQFSQALGTSNESQQAISANRGEA